MGPSEEDQEEESSEESEESIDIEDITEEVEDITEDMLESTIEEEESTTRKVESAARLTGEEDGRQPSQEEIDTTNFTKSMPAKTLSLPVNICILLPPQWAKE